MPLSQLPPAAQYMSASPRSCGCKARNAPSSPVVRSQQYNERLARARMQKNMATMQRRGVNTGACRRCQKAQSAVHLRSLDEHAPQNCATPKIALGSIAGMVVSNRELGPEAFDALSRPGTPRNGPSIDELNQKTDEIVVSSPQLQLQPRTISGHAPGQPLPPDIVRQGHQDPYLQHASRMTSPAKHKSSRRHSRSESPPEKGSTGDDARPPRQVAHTPAVVDTSDLRSFLQRTGPVGAMVQCYIQRRKHGMARLFPTYEVYLKDGDQFLLAARKRMNNKSSNYLISLDKDDLARQSGKFFGKLRSNFIGTEFVLYDKGVNPEKVGKMNQPHAELRQELACILYKQNMIGSRGPRRMKVMVPDVDESGNRAVMRPQNLEVIGQHAALLNTRASLL